MLKIHFFILFLSNLLKFSLPTLNGFAEVYEPVVQLRNGVPTRVNVPRIVAFSDLMVTTNQKMKLFDAWENLAREGHTPAIDEDDYRKYVDNFIHSQELIPEGDSKMVDIFSHDGTKRFTVAFVGSARMMEMFREKIAAGARANSFQQVAKVMDEARKQVILDTGLNLPPQSFLVTDWQQVNTIKLKSYKEMYDPDIWPGKHYVVAKQPETKRRNPKKFLHVKGDKQDLAKIALHDIRRERQTLEREDIRKHIQKMYEEITEWTRHVSASHDIQMLPRDVIDAHTPGNPAAPLETTRFYARGERKRLADIGERDSSEVVEDSIKNGFWDKYGRNYEQNKELKELIEKEYPNVKKHLDQVMGRTPPVPPPRRNRKISRSETGRRSVKRPNQQPFRNRQISPISEPTERPEWKWRKIDGEWRKTGAENNAQSTSAQKAPIGTPRGKSVVPDPPPRPIPRKRTTYRQKVGKK